MPGIQVSLRLSTAPCPPTPASDPLTTPPCHYLEQIELLCQAFGQVHVNLGTREEDLAGDRACAPSPACTCSSDLSGAAAQLMTETKGSKSPNAVPRAPPISYQAAGPLSKFTTTQQEETVPWAALLRGCPEGKDRGGPPGASLPTCPRSAWHAVLRSLRLFVTHLAPCCFLPPLMPHTPLHSSPPFCLMAGP